MNHSRQPTDITGQRFGTLTAIHLHHERNRHGQRQWLCICDCGDESVILQHSLLQGNTTKCDNHPKNEYTFGDDGDAWINVSTPVRPFDHTRVDAEDLERVLSPKGKGGRMRWLSHNSNGEGHERWGIYVVGSDRKTRLHREVLKLDDPQLIVDHINGDTLDNRKVNLRVITRAENNKNMRKRVTNTVGATQVQYNEKYDNYCSRIQLNGVVYTLGTFNTMEEAAAAYFGAAKVLGFSERHGK